MRKESSCRRRWRHQVSALVILLGAGCSDAPNSPSLISASCVALLGPEALRVPGCLQMQGHINARSRSQADSVLQVASRFVDSLSSPSDMAEFAKRSEVIRAMAHVTEFYDRGLFRDSARFHRLIDHVAVTMEYVRGELTPAAPGLPRYRPRRTPFLTWVYYPNLGIFFQPVSSVQAFEFNFDAPWVSTDSLRAVGNALYDYAVWYESGGNRFPVWEYHFPFNSGGVVNPTPWQSGMAQGLVLLVFTQLYDRTKEPLWLERANAVFQSYRVTWDRGGIMLPDTSNGYWFEEFSPINRVWNGSVLALLELDYFARKTGNPEAGRMVIRGFANVKAVTHLYDSGTWTYYSLTQGHNSIAYHQWHVQLADTLFGRTGDPYYQELADRWRSYAPPIGVRNFVPAQ